MDQTDDSAEIEPVDSALTPAGDAETMASFLLDSTDLQREILTETIQSAQDGRVTESGRTVCSKETVKPPLKRLPRAVNLARCPVTDGAGILHTHVTHDELRNPRHSIPDMGNVILADGIAASLIVGLETSEMLLAPSDTERGTATFEEALGVAVSGPWDVERAIRSDTVDSPAQARRRITDALDGLLTRHDTEFPDLRAELHGLAMPEAAPITACSLTHDVHTHTQHPTTAGRLRSRQHRCKQGLKASAKAMELGSKVRDQAIGAAIGTLVGTSVNSVVFDKD
jgi:hypothetical protein